MIKYATDVLFEFNYPWISGSFNAHSLIVLGGGIFIVYTAMKEIFHMLRLEHGEDVVEKPKSTAYVLAMIILMNVIFSFDSILSAMALTDVFWVMAIAIVISGILMMWLANHVSNFLAKNRMYEVLGLFILFVVGIMLVTEGGHLAHLTLFGEHIEAMSKTTFYFVITIVVLNDIAQGFYEKKLKK